MATSPHATAEQVLRGHVTSLVTWTEFRQWMIDRHPDYLTDGELLDLYREHVTHRYDSGAYRYNAGDEDIVAQMNPGDDMWPTTRLEGSPYEVPQHLLGVEFTAEGVIDPSSLFGPIDMERFSRTVRETKRETKPSLTKRAKKALRRAQRAARRLA